MSDPFVTAGGGTQCLGLSSAITSTKELPATIIVVPSVDPHACKDKKVYPFKAIVFYGDTASSVRCFAQADVDWYKRWAVAVQAHFDVLPETPEAITQAISCPPPDPNAVSEPEATVVARDAGKLKVLTDWMQTQYKLRNVG